MEALNVLEQKIASLIESKKQDLELIKQLKSDLACAHQENMKLKEQSEKLEDSLLTRQEESTEKLEELNMVVDDLIKSIDLLVGQEPQP